MDPERELGTVTPLPSVFRPVPPRPVVITVKSAQVPPKGEVAWTWYAIVDRKPGTDHLSYPDEASAKAAAQAWVEENFPGRTVTYEGET